MNDNQLYTFFKERSGSFNETPADALWAKIESGLNNKPEPAKTATTSTIAYIIIGSLIVAGGIAAFLFFGKADEPFQIQEAIELPAETAPAVSTEEIHFEKSTNDTVKRKKALKTLSTEPKQEVMFHKAESQNGVQERAKQLADELFDTEYKTNKLPGKTIVTVKGKISTKLFQKLIEQTLEKNKSSYGDVIIVKAFGHKTFRKVIKIQENKLRLPTNGIIYKDSSYIHFVPFKPKPELHIPATDNLDIECIHFKDTQPIIAPQKAELLDDKLLNSEPTYRGVLVTDSLKTKQEIPDLNSLKPGNHK